jgi:membrane protease YdiL (CAAX protease family)
MPAGSSFTLRSVRPLAAAFIALAVALTGASSYVAFSPGRSGSVSFWAFALGPTIVLAAAASVWAHREGFLAEWLSPRWGDFTRGALGAVGLFVAAWGVTHVLTPTGSPREIWLVSLYGQIGDPRVLQAHAPLVAAAVAVAAIAEELVWRGAVTQLLAQRVGSRLAWVWAAGLYALALVPTAWALRAGGGSNPLLILAAGGAGLVWGGMARVFGGLAPSILAHALFDWAVLMMFPLWGRR